MNPSGSKGVCLDFSRPRFTYLNGCPPALFKSTLSLYMYRGGYHHYI